MQVVGLSARQLPAMRGSGYVAVLLFSNGREWESPMTFPPRPRRCALPAKRPARWARQRPAWRGRGFGAVRLFPTGRAWERPLTFPTAAEALRAAREEAREVGILDAETACS